MKSTAQAPYGNCTVVPPDSDTPMFRCDDERKAWYLERGLAVPVSEDPPVIRLTFRPRGPGHLGDPYFLQEFKNRCVACGSHEGLSHHHIVPNAYRRHFPRTSYQLGRWMYDVLLLCVKCHVRYEEAAHILKEKIASEHGVPSSGIINLTLESLRAMKAAAALCRHGAKIPEERRMSLLADVTTYLGRTDVRQEEFYTIWKGIRNAIQCTPAGVIIMSDIVDIDAFAIRWRRHFVETMRPRFLPEGWDPERRIYSEPDQVEGRTA